MKQPSALNGRFTRRETLLLHSSDLPPLPPFSSLSVQGARPCQRCTSLGKQDMCTYEAPSASNNAGAAATSTSQPPTSSTSISAAPLATSGTLPYSMSSPGPTPLPSARRDSLVGGSPRDDRAIWNPHPGAVSVPSISSSFYPPQQGQPYQPASITTAPPPYPPYVHEMNSRMARIEGLLESFIASASATSNSGPSKGRTDLKRSAAVNSGAVGGPGTPGTVSSRASVTTGFLPPFSEVVYNPRVYENRQLTRSNTPEDEEGAKDGAGGPKEGGEPQNSGGSFSKDKGSTRTTDKERLSQGGFNSSNGNGTVEEKDGRRSSTVQASKNVVSVLGLGGAESAKDPIHHGVVTEERAQELVDL